MVPTIQRLIIQPPNQHLMPPAPPNAILLETLTDRVQAFALYHFLDARGFLVHLEETPLQGVLGEIPFLETGARLYLLEPTHEPQARAAIADYYARPAGIRGTLWECPGCGETHEPEFSSCWQCGQMRS